MSATTVTFTHATKRGGEFEITVPAVFVVCPTCKGKGKTVDSQVDGHGLTREDFAEDPGFLEDYLGGVYDVQCRECSGQRVVEEVVVDQLSRRHHVLWLAREKARVARVNEDRYWARIEGGGE